MERKEREKGSDSARKGREKRKEKQRRMFGVRGDAMLDRPQEEGTGGLFRGRTGLERSFSLGRWTRAKPMLWPAKYHVLNVKYSFRTEEQKDNLWLGKER
jgi:hypothetical protein